MSGIQTDDYAGPRAAAYRVVAGIGILVNAMAVYAEHPHAKQHPHMTQHPSLGCRQSLRHLPGHHAHVWQQGSTPFQFESPSYDNYQQFFETQPPVDLGSLPSQIRQINEIQEKVNLAVLRIQADQRKLQQQIRDQTSWGTRGAGRHFSGPNANLGGRRSFEPDANAGAQKRFQDAPQDFDALVVRGHELSQSGRKEQSRRGPGWRRFLFADVIRALTR